jgi:hypothetical protein
VRAGGTRRRSWVLAAVVLLAASPALGVTLYGGTGGDFAIPGQAAPGSLVSVDLSQLGTSGATSPVADVFDAPPPDPYPAEDGWLQGLATGGNGALFASTFACADATICDEGPSQLLQINPTTGNSISLGDIHDASGQLSIVDLAFDPQNGLLYGISGSLGTSCYGCLYTIDPSNQALATLVGQVPLGSGGPGGLAFAPDGTLYLTTTFPISGSVDSLLTLDPTDASIAAQEDVLLEQQFYQSGGGGQFLITSVPLDGLTVAPDGSLLGVAGANGITSIYERVLGTVKDPNGNVISGQQYVWRNLGDSGQALTGLAFVPEPGSVLLLACGLVGLIGRSGRRGAPRA